MSNLPDVDFQRFLAPTDTPFTTQLLKGAAWTVPDFCAKTKKQTVEPYYDWYVRLLDALRDVTPKEDEDEDWGDWEPSEAYRTIRTVMFDIGRYAYKEVDNPNYNEDQCLAWKEQNMKLRNEFQWTTSDGA